MNSLTELQAELAAVNMRIEKLTPKDSYLDAVHAAFPYGVGGSGRNNYRLNKRKERHLDRIIDTAKELSELYTKRDNLQKRIEDIESGAAEKRELTVHQRRIARAEMWRRLQPGDELPLGNPNGNPIIKKKNRLSAETTSGTKWTAAEVIGREAARMI